MYSPSQLTSMTASKSAHQLTLDDKRFQEEELCKAVRELAKIPTNKYCSECGQRGPTYVNVTQGTFCCMNCSGLLRGLTPPHRVKSISMSTFTIPELDLLRKRGNEWNKNVYLSLFKGVKPFPQPINIQSLKDHLILKYEKRMWYSAPRGGTTIIGANEPHQLPSETHKFSGFKHCRGCYSGPPSNNSSSVQRSAIPRVNASNLMYPSSVVPLSSYSLSGILAVEDPKKGRNSLFDDFDKIFGPPLPADKPVKLLSHSNSMFNFPTVQTKLPASAGFDQVFDNDPFEDVNNKIEASPFDTPPSDHSNGFTYKQKSHTLYGIAEHDQKLNEATFDSADGNFAKKVDAFANTTTCLDNPFKREEKKAEDKHIYTNPFSNLLSTNASFTNNPFISQSDPNFWLSPNEPCKKDPLSGKKQFFEDLHFFFDGTSNAPTHHTSNLLLSSTSSKNLNPFS
uniref:Arf-GAP domain-containing protein n=1 Tax=Rhabditophanes sp. KR3021 TaxID=114890 RepID=A0AC35TQX3_9BILA